MPYIAGVDYPYPKDINEYPTMSADLHQVTVLRGPKDIKAYPVDCINNALRFKETYDVEVVRGWIGDPKKAALLVQHYWNFDGLNYYDVTPFPKDFKFKYYLEETA